MALLHLALLFAVPALLVGVVSLLLRLRRRGSPGSAIARVAPHPLTWVAALAGGYVPGTAAIELSAMECSCEYLSLIHI